MRPHRLELQGFTAYRERQAIDFTSLDLFVITGPTGAGKTSLLDAMSLALYGRVPRMGGQGLGQLVSHGQAEARVLLEFGVNGDVYRVARRLPRNGAQSATFERRDGERWVDVTERAGVRAVNEAVIDCVVLDFESFCKAIVLPQGEFARFLKGDPPERRKTLVALLGLGAYERMGALARERAGELRIRAQQTQSILDEQFADATGAALTVAEAEVVTTTAAAQAATDLLARARTIDSARADAEARASTTSRLAERFAALADDLTREIRACRDAEDARRNAEARCEQARAAAETAARAGSEAESRQAELVQREGTAEELSRLVDAVDRRRGQDQRVADAERELRAAVAAHEERRRALEHSDRRAGEDTAAARLARQAEAAARVVQEERRLERDRVSQRHTDALKTEAAFNEARSQVTALEAEAATAETTFRRARETQVILEQRLEALRREHLVVALVGESQVGDPCPVCARPLTEQPQVDREVAEHLGAQEADCSAAEEAAERAQQASATATGALHAAQARVSELARALEGEDVRDVAVRAREAERAAEAAAHALSEAVNERERADAASHASAAALERARAELEAAEEMITTRQTNLKEATDQRAATLSILRARFGDSIPDDAADQLAAAHAALQVATERLEQARRRAAEAHDALRNAEHSTQAAQAALAAIDIRLAELRSRAQIGREQATDIDLPSLPVAANARDVNAGELAEWCTRGADTLVGRCAALEAEAERAATDLLALAAGIGLFAEDVHAAREQLVGYERTAAEARVRADAAAAELTRRVEQRAQMEATIADGKRKTAVLDVLARDLRADHFTDFVVQETLDLLAMRASAELRRISDDRYSLVSSEGGFSVIDHVNADEQRSVKTLSGGETFMASLSLALALSKHVSELAGEGLGARLEAVFIDEGFGSLDSETLDEVIDALERLREDELLVGVISHVPALAQRIRAGLEIRTSGGHSTVAQAA